MKLVIVSDFWHGSLGSSYARAFRAAGCDVGEFDYHQAYLAIGPLARNRYSTRLFDGYFNSIVNKGLLEYVEAFKPSIVFVIKGSFLFPETTLALKQLPRTLVSCFNPDNPFNRNRGASNDYIRNAIPNYDCYFTWGQFLVPLLMKSGARRVEYLPFASDPGLHFPVDVTDSEREIYSNDVAFIGTWEKEREDWLGHLVDYDLGIWGNLWQRADRKSLLRAKWKGRPALGEEFSKVCGASKIVLNLIRAQNGDAHNMRTFEVPACRGFMLTFRTKGQAEFFEEGKEIACFESPGELKEKLNEYLARPDLRAPMSAAAYQRVQGHTYSERVHRILEVHEEIKRER